MKWNKEQIALKESLYQWKDVLSKDHISHEKNGFFCSTKWRHISESGLLSVPFDKEYGGMQQDLLTTMFLLEQLGFICKDSGLNFVVSTHIVSSGVVLNRFGSLHQKSKYLPGICDGSIIGAHAITEPGTGSDAFSMQTTAKPVNGGYVLNGSKIFTSNAPISNLIIVYAMTDKNKGALGGCTAFIINSCSQGLSIGKPLEKMGLKNAPMAELYFDDCFVAEEDVVGKVGQGFSIFDYIMKWEVLCSFIINVGEMQRRFDKCLTYAKTRKQFGQKIGKYQAISHQLVDMKIKLETSRDWLYRAGKKMQNNKNASMDIAIAKLICSEANFDSAIRAVRIFGGYGYMTEYGLEKELRQSIAGTIYSGTSEIIRNRIASNIGL